VQGAPLGRVRRAPYSAAGCGEPGPNLGHEVVLAGLRYAFPRAMRRQEKKVPGLVALHDRIRERPKLAEYLASERRVPFNQMGIFRHYPELDAR